MDGSCLSVSPRGSIIHIAEKAVLMTDGFGGPWREMRSGGAGGTDPVSRSGEGERASEWGLYRAKQARRFPFETLPHPIYLSALTPSTPCQNAATYPDWFQVAGGYAPGSCLFLGGFSGVFRSCDDGCTWKARVLDSCEQRLATPLGWRRIGTYGRRWMCNSVSSRRCTWLRRPTTLS